MVEHTLNNSLLVDLVWYAEKFTQYYLIQTHSSDSWCCEFCILQEFGLQHHISSFRFDDAWAICQQANSAEYWNMLAGEASRHLDIEFGIVYKNVLIEFCPQVFLKRKYVSLSICECFSFVKTLEFSLGLDDLTQYTIGLCVEEPNFSAFLLLWDF